jgi:hypothetical protein
MKLNLILNEIESSLFGELCDKSYDLLPIQLYNMATYIDVVRKNKNINTINSSNDILQAINYDSDENNNYWIILNNNFCLFDMCIPSNASFENNKLFENLSNDEIDILSTILTYN